MIPSKVVRKEVIAKDIAHIYLKPLKEFREPIPGQFIMVWVPGYEEIPMSISDYSDNLIRITVKVRGGTTNYLVNELSVSDYLGVRGPLGRGITKDMIYGRGLLVAGGVGIAPIAFTVKSYSELVRGSKLLAGFATRDEAVVVNELLGYLDVEVITEDVVGGGTVIDLLRKEVGSGVRYDYYIVAGPKAVLDQVVSLMPDWVSGYVLAESFMKCGIGFCGSCALKDFIVCRDGTLVDALTYRRLIS